MLVHQKVEGNRTVSSFTFDALTLFWAFGAPGTGAGGLDSVYFCIVTYERRKEGGERWWYESQESVLSCRIRVRAPLSGRLQATTRLRVSTAPRLVHAHEELANCSCVTHLWRLLTPLFRCLSP